MHEVQSGGAAGVEGEAALEVMDLKQVEDSGATSKLARDTVVCQGAARMVCCHRWKS